MRHAADVRFTPAERRLVRRLASPALVQRYLNGLPYNTEPPPGGPTLRSFRGVVSAGTAHCLESAVTAAVILEQHGYPPLLLSFESIDELDHVLFVYRENGLWGSVARSRDPGLHGRQPVFPNPRALASSYIEPYVDFTGRITGYAVVDLRTLGDYDWRLSERNVWKVERLLLGYPHRPSEAPTPGSTGCGPATSHSGGSSPAGNRRTIPAGSTGRTCRANSHTSPRPAPDSWQRTYPEPPSPIP